MAENTSKFPAGHVVAVAYARIFGPKLATDPTGLPPLYTTGLFDATAETPVHAMARAALKWHGIPIAEDDWALLLEEDVLQLEGHKPIPYSKVYVYDYLPDKPIWVQRGLDDTSVPNHFKDCYYLTKNWAIKKSWRKNP